MAAIITDDFRRNQARNLMNDIKAAAGNVSSLAAGAFRETDTYAIGIGKSDIWKNDSSGNDENNDSFVVPVPIGAKYENRDVINNMFSLSEVAANGVKQVIPKNPWTSGRKYKVYDPNDNDLYYVSGDFYPCYVTFNNNIYICLSNTAAADSDNTGTTPVASTQSPSAAAQGISVETDGYVWAHVQTIDTSANAKFITGQFVPVDDAGTTSTTQDGLLTHISVTDGGSGYTSAPTVTLFLRDDSDPDSPLTKNTSAKAIVESGVVTKIQLQGAGAASTDDGESTYWSSPIEDVRNATVVIAAPTSGRTATAVAGTAFARGFSARPLDVLPTWFLNITTDFDGEEDGDAAILPFRQVSLLKNFSRTDDGETPTTTNKLDGLKYFQVATPTTAALAALNPGDVIFQETGNVNGEPKMYFDKWDSANSRIYYHQNTNNDVNFIQPNDASGASQALKVAATSGSLSVGDTLGAGVVNGSHEDAEYAHDDANAEYNGEVIFFENRRPFNRATSQKEEVKLIIQL